jgi:hypothetical protein
MRGRSRTLRQPYDRMVTWSAREPPVAAPPNVRRLSAICPLLSRPSRCISPPCSCIRRAAWAEVAADVDRGEVRGDLAEQDGTFGRHSGPHGLFPAHSTASLDDAMLEAPWAGHKASIPLPEPLQCPTPRRGGAASLTPQRPPAQMLSSRPTKSLPHDFLPRAGWLAVGRLELAHRNLLQRKFQNRESSLCPASPLV